jgi:hypothetical protein
LETLTITPVEPLLSSFGEGCKFGILNLSPTFAGGLALSQAKEVGTSDLAFIPTQEGKLMDSISGTSYSFSLTGETQANPAQFLKRTQTIKNINTKKYSLLWQEITLLENLII